MKNPVGRLNGPSDGVFFESEKGFPVSETLFNNKSIYMKSFSVDENAFNGGIAAA